MVHPPGERPPGMGTLRSPQASAKQPQPPPLPRDLSVEQAQASWPLLPKTPDPPHPTPTSLILPGSISPREEFSF